MGFASGLSGWQTEEDNDEDYDEDYEAPRLPTHWPSAKAEVSSDQHCALPAGGQALEVVDGEPVDRCHADHPVVVALG